MRKIFSSPNIGALIALAGFNFAFSMQPSDPMAESLLILSKQVHPTSQTSTRKPTAVASTSIALDVTSKAHLHCVFRINKSGRASLIHSTEVKGEPLMPEATGGGFIYTVSKGAEVIAMQGMPDPFERRSAPRPGDKNNEGHHFESVEEADVIVKIPNTRLTDVTLNDLSLDFFEYQGDSHLEKLDKLVLSELKFKNKLKRLSNIPVSTLRQALKDRFVPAVN